MVDKRLILRKIERINEHLEQVRGKKDPGLKAFIQDKDLQSIILFNLIQAIQGCTDMGAHIISDSGWETPSTLAEIFEVLARHQVITPALSRKMVQMVGFRNRIVHDYERIDLGIVHTVWKKHLSDIEKFCKTVVLALQL